MYLILLARAMSSHAYLSSVDDVALVDSLHDELRPPLLHRATTRQLQFIDYLLAGVVAAVTTIHLSLEQRTNASGEDVLIIVLAITAATAISLRRRYPVAALALITLSTSLVIIFPRAFFAEPLIAIPMYQVASRYERGYSLPALSGVFLIIVISVFAHFAIHSRGVIISPAIIAAVTAWFVGDSVRVRRKYVTGLTEQAAQRQREILERAQRSVAEERLQIARDLHDVVAHSLSVIAVQSGVGRHVIDEHPGQAKIALTAVEDTSRTALVELRRMLGVLRRDEREPAPLVPAPGVASLERLLEHVRLAGFEVSLHLSSQRSLFLTPTADLAIYRIVQEALTNVVKHAGPTSVRVELRDEPDSLVLEILDSGPGPATTQSEDAPNPSHHGILGMRERVALFDGSLDANSRRGGGFRVLARFPIANLDLS